MLQFDARQECVTIVSITTVSHEPASDRTAQRSVEVVRACQATLREASRFATS